MTDQTIAGLNSLTPGYAGHHGDVVVDVSSASGHVDAQRIMLGSSNYITTGDAKMVRGSPGNANGRLLEVRNASETVAWVTPDGVWHRKGEGAPVWHEASVSLPPSTPTSPASSGRCRRRCRQRARLRMLPELHARRPCRW